MQYFVLISLYALLATLSSMCVYWINYKRLTFADGLLFTTLYYVAVPFGLIMYAGEFRVEGDAYPPFRPFDDVPTSLNLLLGWAVVIVFQVVTRKPANTSVGALRPNVTFSKRKQSPSAHPTALRSYTSAAGETLIRDDLSRSRQMSRDNSPASRHIIATMFLLYIFSDLVVFIFARATGSDSEALSDHPYFLILMVMSNGYRAMLFGLLIYATEEGKLSRMTASIAGLFIVVFDVVTSLNRVTAAFLVVAALIIYRRYLIFLLLGMAPLVPVVAFASRIWMTVRALGSANGYSIESFRIALDTALAHDAQSAILYDNIAEKSNSIFETSNLFEFNWLVNNVPGVFAPLQGSTFFLRPLTVFLPSSVWPDKPRPFAAILGNYMYGDIALNSTPFGEAYGNFYYMWPIMLLLMFTAVFFIFRLLTKAGHFVGFCAFFIAFAYGRFDMDFVAAALVALLIAVSASLTLNALIGGTPSRAGAARKHASVNWKV